MRRARLFRAVLVCVAALALAAEACAESNPRVGFYQWAGENPLADDDLLTAARARVKAAGAGLLRLYLGARFDYVRPVLSPDRFAGLKERTPAAILQLPRYRAVLEDPELATVVLTTYTSADYGAGPDDLNLLRPWGEREREHEYRQIFELARLLLSRYGDRPKTVIISNAEADDKMLEIMQYSGSPDLAIENLRAWQNTRFRAVDEARRLHPKARLRLLAAFEISLVNLKIRRRGGRFVKDPAGSWNALSDVVPHVRFDILSYSSYESTNSPYETRRVDAPPGDVEARLLRDLKHIRRVAGTPVMIGELGMAREVFEGLPSGGVEPRLDAALKALRAARPEYVVFWQAFDAPADGPPPFGWGWLVPRRPAPPALLDFIREFRRPAKGASRAGDWPQIP